MSFLNNCRRGSAEFDEFFTCSGKRSKKGFFYSSVQYLTISENFVIQFCRSSSLYWSESETILQKNSATSAWKSAFLQYLPSSLSTSKSCMSSFYAGVRVISLNMNSISRYCRQ